ncbi:MAG: glucokinase [Gammaproteobacteria bacterium]|nr:glucokinase [Gammaproteobacteria bacterium]
MKILAGDIGGTKTLLQLAHYSDNRFSVLAETRFESRSFDTFEAVLETFLSQNALERDNIGSACIAVAGPVEQQQAKVTNLPWRLDASHLAGVFFIPRVVLVNDFQAIGYGIEQLTDSDVVTLQAGNAVTHGVRAVIGAGTGVGHAIMAWCNNHYQVLSSEAGHSSFAPVNALQRELLAYLETRFDVVSVERVLSGPGIENIFRFFCGREPGVLTRELAQATQQHDIAAAVVKAALAKQDPLAVKTLEMFIEVYGAAAGNLALYALARGGIYIAGGIAPRIVDRLTQRPFIAAFNNKSNMQPLLSNIPVKVVMNPQVGLLGAAVYAVRKA